MYQTHLGHQAGSGLQSSLRAKSGLGQRAVHAVATTAAMRQAAMVQEATCCGRGAPATAGQWLQGNQGLCPISLVQTSATDGHVHQHRRVVGSAQECMFSPDGAGAPP